MPAALPLLPLDKIAPRYDDERKRKWHADTDAWLDGAEARVKAEAERIIASWRADPSQMPMLSGSESDRASYVVGRGFVHPDSY